MKKKEKKKKKKDAINIRRTEKRKVRNILTAL